MSDLKMTVSEAVATRSSIRAFSTQPVEGQLVRRLLDAARQTPSGGNLQPWHVTILGGATLQGLKQLMKDQVSQGLKSPEGSGYQIYPRNLPEPYLSRRDRCTEMMYATMSVARADKPTRIAFVKENFQFWNAPVGMFFSIHRCMGAPQWSDLGMFIQTVMLLAREAGLHSCPQECWTNWHALVENYIDIPADRMLFCGLALGYADESHPVNTLRTERAPLEEIAEFRGI